jgi:predicted amidohydrolase YtcJ
VTPAALVVVDAEVAGRSAQAVRIEDGLVVQVGGAADVDRRGAEVIDAAGGAVVPGLHDHHLHLLGLAARLSSLDLADDPDPATVDRRMHEAATTRGPGVAGSWLRVTGYDEHRHGRLDRWRLDALGAGRPIRVQHRSGLSWVVSTDAMERLGLDADPVETAVADPEPDRRPGVSSAVEAEPGALGGGAGVERTAEGTATGWLHRLDRWMGERIGRTPPDLARVGRLLAAAGVTGATDTTPVLDDDSVALLADARATGDLPQHLVVLGRADATGLGGRMRLGPVKLVVDEHSGLDVEGLTDDIRRAHGRGRRAALHCVTRAECVAAVVALVGAGPGPGDRLEHASVLPPDLDPVLAAAGVVVVTQPRFVWERGDHYLDAVDPADRPHLYRLASLRAAGVAVALSSDAPVASPDPWAALTTAADRRTRSGRVLSGHEAVEAAVALEGYLTDAMDPGGPLRRLVVGAPADLCVLPVPLAGLGDMGPGTEVRSTIVGGKVVHG